MTNKCKPYYEKHNKKGPVTVIDSDNAGTKEGSPIGLVKTKKA